MIFGDHLVASPPDRFAGAADGFNRARGPELGKELRAFVAGQVAHYKQIRRLTFTDAVPKSASGKILRRVLRDGG